MIRRAWAAFRKRHKTAPSGYFYKVSSSVLDSLKNRSREATVNNVKIDAEAAAAP